MPSLLSWACVSKKEILGAVWRKLHRPFSKRIVLPPILAFEREPVWCQTCVQVLNQDADALRLENVLTKEFAKESAYVNHYYA